MTARLTEEAQRWSHRLESLSQCVEEALRRAEAGRTHLGNGVAGDSAWTLEALAYLERRRDSGSAICPLPELFAALRSQHADLSMTSFHDGLRRLHHEVHRQSTKSHIDAREPNYPAATALLISRLWDDAGFVCRRESPIRAEAANA